MKTVRSLDLASKSQFHNTILTRCFVPQTPQTLGTVNHDLDWGGRMSGWSISDLDPRAVGSATLFLAPQGTGGLFHMKNAQHGDQFLYSFL